MNKRIIIWSRQRINPNDVNTQKAAQSLKKYVDNWFIHFDTADHYADGEEILGLVKKVYKNHITVGTKRCPNPWPIQDNEVRKAVEKSLKRLQSNHIDLMQFHDRLPEDGYGIERINQLKILQTEWLIKKIWLTNANTSYIKKVIDEGISIVSNQVCYSLLTYRPDSNMQKICKENNIELLAFWTVAGWFFSEKRLNQPEPNIETLGNASLKKYKRFIDVRGWREFYQEILQTLHTIAQHHRVSIATVASNFILQQPEIGWVIVGARLGESEHIEENKKILSLQLNQQEIQQIENIINQWNLLPWDFGDEYRLDHSDLPWWHISLTSTGKSWYAWHQNKYIK